MVKKFAQENNIPFKVSGVTEIIEMNYQVIKRYTGEGKSILNMHKDYHGPVDSKKIK